MTMRFTTNGYYIYDHFKEDKWLVNEVEAEEIVTVMNNLDTKARERSKALSNLQKENEKLKKENDELKSIKRFAEKHGINIFKIDEAFQKCWNDNGKLIKENNKLHQKIFEMRTNLALDRTEISRQSYTSKEFLDLIEKW